MAEHRSELGGIVEHIIIPISAKRIPAELKIKLIDFSLKFW